MNLVNLESVGKAYGTGAAARRACRLGVAAGERIGVVGRNGGGKTTLLSLLAGDDDARRGRVTHAPRPADRLPRPARRPDDEPHRARRSCSATAPSTSGPATPRSARSLAGLLAGIGPGRATWPGSPAASAAGSRWPGCCSADARPADPRRAHQPPRRRGASPGWPSTCAAPPRRRCVVVTHDRWFLDAVCEHTWEVARRRRSTRYDGGYAAYVLARAERDRQAAATEARRQNLLRKELAWLRRGAAGPHVQAEVPDRRGQRADRRRAAAARRGSSCSGFADRPARQGRRRRRGRRPSRVGRPASLLDHVTWRLGPGDRIGIVGVNGAGKTTLLRLLAGAARARRRAACKQRPDGRARRT